jgi:hypothetical protein
MLCAVDLSVELSWKYLVSSRLQMMIKLKTDDDIMLQFM